MAKVNCAICGKEINIFQQVQLASAGSSNGIVTSKDHDYVCKACWKKACPFAYHLDTTLQQYKDHMVQLEEGNKLYAAYFDKKNKANKTKARKKALQWIYKKSLFNKNEFCLDGENDLIFVGTSTGAFKKNYFRMVYRLADLDQYTLEKNKAKKDGGPDYFVNLTFRNVAGLATLRFPSAPGDFKKLEKILNKLFGRTGLKGIANAFNTAKANVQSAKNIINAAKDGAKAAQEGGADENNAELAAQAETIAEEMNAMFYNGREEQVARADAAIKAVLG